MRKKFVAMLMTLTCTVSVAACSNGAASGGDNTAPVIEGAADATVMAGTEFDALSGITASDDQV